MANRYVQLVEENGLTKVLLDFEGKNVVAICDDDTMRVYVTDFETGELVPADIELSKEQLRLVAAIIAAWRRFDVSPFDLCAA